MRSGRERLWRGVHPAELEIAEVGVGGGGGDSRETELQVGVISKSDFADRWFSNIFRMHSGSPECFIHGVRVREGFDRLYLTSPLRRPSLSRPDHSVDDLREAIVALADRAAELPDAADFSSEHVAREHVTLALHGDQPTVLDHVAAVAQNLELCAFLFRISLIQKVRICFFITLYCALQWLASKPERLQTNYSFRRHPDRPTHHRRLLRDLYASQGARGVHP